MDIDKTRLSNDLERCVRCGICKAHCPTYDSALSEGMGARGRIALIKALLDGSLKPSNLLNERIFSCILCEACTGTCPLGVDITGLIYACRNILSGSDRKRLYIRSIMKFFTKWPDLSFRLIHLSRHLLLPVLVRRGLLPFYPDMPEAPLKSAGQVHKVDMKKGRVAIFAGCTTNYLLPHLGESLINVLKRFNYEVVLPKGEVCCGAPLRSLGLDDEARRLASKNYSVFSRLKVDAILTLCPTCALTLKEEYKKLIGTGIDKVVDISVFFMDRLSAVNPIQKSAVYHDPCHLYYGLGIKSEPRVIIKKAGLDLVDQTEQGCCGFGGLFCLSFKETSVKLLDMQAQRLLNSGADAIITSCPGCMLQLSRSVADRPIIHLVEVIEEAYCHRK